MSLDPNSDGTVFAQRNETLGQSVHEVSRPRPCDPMRVSERASERNEFCFAIVVHSGFFSSPRSRPTARRVTNERIRFLVDAVIVLVFLRRSW